MTGIKDNIALQGFPKGRVTDQDDGVILVLGGEESP